jgi:hypothetical protein
MQMFDLESSKTSFVTCEVAFALAQSHSHGDDVGSSFQPKQLESFYTFSIGF